MKEEEEEVARVRNWIGRLEGFISSFDGLDGETPIDFCESACDTWQSTVMSDSPPPTSPAILVIVESFGALAKVMTTVSMDWADTPDVRDRLTRSDVEQQVKDALDGICHDARRWLAEGLPSDDEIKQRIASAGEQLHESLKANETKNAELEAEDAEAESDPYGAILVHLDPSRSDAPIFEKVCSLTEDEDMRYRDAYEQLRRMIDSELLQHISDESDRLWDVLMALLMDLRDNRIPIFDEDAWDEHRRKVRSALISFTAALHIHREQTINAAKKTFGRDTAQLAAVEQLFTDLRKSSFEYGWLEEMRGALQHGDINAFRYDFSARVNGEPAANVYMSRKFMLDFTRRSSRKKWLKRRELEDMESDPSVVDMINAIQPLMGPLQAKLDKILYPNVADDVATVRELLSQYPGKPGLHALQNGPGFTRRNLWPAMTPLAPRVLAFVANYEGAQ
ncbi:hypothetical protein [Mycobacterium conspicuum]|uniref:Uncharacterized protein n=1 Tax=Mycobacterium conspicuum TaxID=44010 RepID=A0A1X1TC89_9MYCO|nr:hypothetical protein [Mycobacterium conspicuum]ORV42129.1 hypothetical protein AWC00_12895 [Mycobacterium conspicuum]BBZ38774.1 hypothetical protein MCNS_18370 [Mycobacterium conspicuum]